MDEETRNVIDGLDRRVQKLEELVSVGETTKAHIEIGLAKEYRGLQGGINLLLDENFFSVPKSKAETMKQLAVKGYHHPEGAVQAALARDFMKKKRVLTRIKEGKVYKYVIRK